MSKKIDFDHDGYVMVRRPLLSLDTFDNLNHDIKKMDDSEILKIVENLLGNKSLSLALRLASPGLFNRLIFQKNKSDMAELILPLFRYFIRMSTRCTPFSAFASVGLGQIGIDGNGEIEDSIDCRLNIDCGVLSEISERIKLEANIFENSKIRVNPTFYFIGNAVHYFERKNIKGRFEFNLARISHSELIGQVLNFMSSPKTVGDVVENLILLNPDVEKHEAFTYIINLIDIGLLEIDAELQIIGENTLNNFLERIKSIDQDIYKNKHVNYLFEIQRIINESQGATVENACVNVESIEKILKSNEYKFSTGKAVQVDSFLNSERFVFPKSVLSDLSIAINKLATIFPKKENERLSEFAKKFEKRFGEKFVPLGVALDPESGISYGFSAPAYQWAQDIGIQQKNLNLAKSTDISFQSQLFEIISSSQEEIDLLDFDIKISPETLPIAESFSVNLSLYDFDPLERTQKPKIYLNFLSGSGAANITARFSSKDESLTNSWRKSITKENNSDPDIILAEIVHAPNPRVLNVLSRPSGREYEIIISGSGSVPPDRQILINDLFIGLLNSEIILWSKKLNKQVVPCLTSAHNYSGFGNLGIYQFLCELRNQSVNLPNFYWNSSFNNIPKLPRVVCGSVIVKLAQWKISEKNIKSLVNASKNKDWKLVREILAKNNLPKIFSLQEGDHVLEVDQENELALAMFIQSIKKLKRATIIESPARLGKPFCNFKGEKWHTEIVIPLHKTKKDPLERMGSISNLLRENINSYTDNLKQKSSTHRWHYFKIYGGEQIIETLLIEELEPILDKFIKEKKISKWFFVRYADPEFHLRLRFFGDSVHLSDCVSKILVQILLPKQNTHELSAINTEMYLPEVIRYGGHEIMSHIEEIFRIDSVFCVEIIRISKNKNDNNFIWKGALSGTLQLLRTFISDMSLINIFSINQRDSFASEMDMQASHHERLGMKYREFKIYIEGVVAEAIEPDSEIIAALDRRNFHINSYLNQIETGVSKEKVLKGIERCLPSIIHMQMNRIFTGNSRPQEFIIWEYIVRAFRSIEARRK